MHLHFKVSSKKTAKFQARMRSEVKMLTLRRELTYFKIDFWNFWLWILEELENNPSIMEQTLIFSGFTSFPGRNFWRGGRIAFFGFGSACSFSFYGKINLLFEGDGIVDVDRLYPLKPKQPV